MGANVDGKKVLGQVLEEKVLQVARAVEDAVDEEIGQLGRLENDKDDLDQLRRERLHQLKKSAEKRQAWIANGHGEYTEVPSEKAFFAEVKKSERVVCHFYRDNWPCKVVDKHVSLLAKQHLETRFVKINAEKSPYLSEKLRIVVLPTLALIKNGKVEDYVVGFDQLGGRDDFRTEVLEERLQMGQFVFHDGVCMPGFAPRPAESSHSQSQRRSIRQGVSLAASDDDDDDE
ncbi:hypothetical protein CBR_g41441 [Chara braunii]|uniref:Thioredoxin domain-containing protein n=1 Tax=Chara braunii TaxID=69332 RepID=A0A388LW04_CHABU|nr:hypothetical protein CBR_g41441 [Chara braunii]|eukprot:GBG86445.1 hypothetical protein CBR_g41441 [Chara braunii]